METLNRCYVCSFHLQLSLSVVAAVQVCVYDAAAAAATARTCNSAAATAVAATLI